MNAGQKYVEQQVISQQLAQDSAFVAHLLGSMSRTLMRRVHDDGHEMAGNLTSYVSDEAPLWASPDPTRWQRLLTWLRLVSPPKPPPAMVLLRVECSTRARRPAPPNPGRRTS